MSITPLASDIQKFKGHRNASLEIGSILRQYWSDIVKAEFENQNKEDISISLATSMGELISTAAGELCSANIAIAAIGGFGRGRLAPYSDVDLLILVPESEDEKACLPFMHALWDAELGLSPMVHTVRTAMVAAEEETITRTAFLDARLLFGASSLFLSFQSQFHQLRKRTITDFIAEKMAERDKRHAQSTKVNEIEPDIKEGRGGLRDLDTLYWIELYISGETETLYRAPGGEPLFTKRERRRLQKLKQFFWNVRVHLHQMSQRSDDRLHFESQEHLAHALGFSTHAGRAPVEAFMRYYFLCTKEVMRLTSTALDTIARHANTRSVTQSAMDRVYSRMTQDYPFGGESNLVRRSGLLTFMDHARVLTDVREMFALFRVAAEYEVEIDPAALKTVARGAKLLPPACRDDEGANEAFLAILRTGKHLETILRQMTDVGLLGRFLPGFGGCIGVVEYGLFRQYTLEEHVLLSVGVLSDLLLDQDDGRFKLTKPRLKTFKDPTFIYFALLLQEVSVGLTNCSSEHLRERILENINGLLLDEEEVELVVYATINSQLLTRTATRRNVHDTDLIERTASLIPSTKHLSLLAILAACRHSAAGIRSWEEYAKRDVRALVEGLEAYLVGGAASLKHRITARNKSLRQDVRQQVKSLTDESFDRIWARVGQHFLSMADSEAASELVSLIERVDASNDRGGAVVLPHTREGVRIICYFEDRPGMFADSAGLAASMNASIFEAVAFDLGTTSDGTAMAGLILNMSLEHMSYDEARESLEERFALVARGEVPDSFTFVSLIGDRRKLFKLAPIVAIDQHASKDSLVLEVEALDRTGLLYDLARCFRAQGLSIKQAIIATYGHRAVDTFYLQTKNGKKPEGDLDTDRLMASVRNSLG